MMYSSPNVIQNRNEHNLISDFKSEYEMYIHNENIIKYIENGINNTDTNNTDTIKDMLLLIYNNLLNNNVITNLDIQILNKWFMYF